MPHSSGGGSHGGGGHGGSSGGGGGSSGRSSRTYFAGAKTYVRYDHATRTPVITYANYDMTQSTLPGIIVISVMFGPMILLMWLALLIASFHLPFRLNTDYDTEIVIDDQIDVMSDSEEENLNKTLKKFFKETGITPAVVTVYNEVWEEDYDKLEDYAYDLYLQSFKDEKHWLIVYSQPVYPDDDFNDWYWEGMQGNDTDSILTTKETDIFNKRLQKDLVKGSVTPGKAINNAFKELTPHVMDFYVNWLMLIIGSLFVGGMTAGFVLLILSLVRKEKQIKSTFKCEETVISQAKCDYCGGVYIVGHHANCPYCQAALPLQDSLGSVKEVT